MDSIAFRWLIYCWPGVVVQNIQRRKSKKEKRKSRWNRSCRRDCWEEALCPLNTVVLEYVWTRVFFLWKISYNKRYSTFLYRMTHDAQKDFESIVYHFSRNRNNGPQHLWAVRSRRCFVRTNSVWVKMQNEMLWEIDNSSLVLLKFLIFLR